MRRGRALVRARASRVFGVALALLGLAVVRAEMADPQTFALSETPPLKQTITYVGKTTTTDFRGPGMGQHLQYFPAFDLDDFQSGLPTDCDGCIEWTPEFENFKHHLGLDALDRTFSPDAGGEPVGVKTAGGDPSWDVFILPDGTTGTSGTTYDEHACGNANNFVNQLRINTGTLQDFCLNLITDNSGPEHAPNLRLEARADDSDADFDLGAVPQFGVEGQPEPHPDFSFDGETDVYTFRYMGMSEGDRIRIRIQGEGGAGCAGPGLGGIMVSHISTCTPPPGTCTPDCSGRLCGDDGCGGSCGECPRVDKLVRRTGHVGAVVYDEDGSVQTGTQDDVEIVASVGDTLRGEVSDIETDLQNKLRSALVQEFNEYSFNVRNVRLTLTRSIGVESTALATGSHAFTARLEQAFLKFKLKPEADDNTKFIVKITVPDIAVSGLFDPISGEITNLAATNGPVTVDIDGGGGLGSVISLFDDFGDFLPDVIADALDLSVIEGALARVVESEIDEELAELAGDAEGFVLLPLALVPETIQVAGFDYGPQIRQALLAPTVGDTISLHYDATDPQIVSPPGFAIETLQEAVLVLDVGGDFVLTASQRTTRFPEVRADIELASFDHAGDYVVEGWVCAVDLEESLEVGLFSDGHAVRIVTADLVSEPEVGEQCTIGGIYDRYRYALEVPPEELVSVNGWDNQLSVVAGYGVFEDTLGDVYRSHSTPWLLDADSATSVSLHPDPGHRYVADFTGDGRDDYMFREVATGNWYVAVSTGGGFAPPMIWLTNGDSPTGKSYHVSAAFQFVADFSGDGRSDYLFKQEGTNDWYAAVSNGDGFETPALWLDASTAPAGPTHNAGYMYVADFDGDGRSDYLYKRSGIDEWLVARSTGNGLEPPLPWLFGAASPTGRTYHADPSFQLIGDFDGNGRSDYLFKETGGGDWYVALSSGNSFHTPTLWLGEVDAPGFPTFNRGYQYVADFDGDGADDYLWKREGVDEWYVARSRADVFDLPTRWLAGSDSPTGQAYHEDPHNFQFLGDFDGDGRTDYLFKRPSSNDWFVALSEGERFAKPLLWLSLTAYLPERTYSENATRQYLGDFSGDGTSQFLHYDNPSGAWYVTSTLLPRPAAPLPPRPPGGC
ncbi:MAG: VCBS repeat-containing protein [bacterium]|nr:VCBS repeat-containing protein [bacterium]